MAKQTRSREETYEVCDFCQREIAPIYDERLVSLWPLFSPKIRADGILSKAKWLIANWSMESGKQSYALHARCAHQMLSTILELRNGIKAARLRPENQCYEMSAETFKMLEGLTVDPLNNGYGRF